MYVLIGVGKSMDDHSCRLIGTYETADDAHKIMVMEVQSAIDDDYYDRWEHHIEQFRASVYDDEVWDEWFIFNCDAPDAHYF